MPFRVGIPRRLPARRGIRLNNLTLFPARRRLGRGSRFRSSRRLNALSRCDSGSLFGLLQGAYPRRLGRRRVFPLLLGDPIRLSRHSFGLLRCQFCLVPGLQLRFPGLLCRAPAKLRPVLPARRRKIAILGTMKVCPGVQNRYIFGRFHYRKILVPVYVAHIHALVLDYW